MKRLSFFAICLLAITGLVSCYWMGNYNTGSLNMDFSQVQARQAGDVVRVYLLANGLLFSTEVGVPFAAEVSLGTGEDTVIKISGLPVGPHYQALVGVGSTDQGIFRVDYHGESEEFQISPGDDITVTTTLDYIPSFNGIYFSADLMGKHLTGVAESGSDVYAAEASKLYLVYLNYIDPDYVVSLADSYDLADDPYGEGVKSYRVNGLSPGYFSAARMNSNNGIVPFYGGDGWNFDTTLSSALGGNKEIEESGVFSVSVDYALFFRRADGIGGVHTVSGVQQPWVNLDVSGVRDMVVSNNNAYFATEGGAFALPPAFLLDSTPTLAGHQMNFSAPDEILSLGYRPPTVGPITLFMGTTDGVWEAQVTNESPVTLGTLTQIPETAGQNIDMIDISSAWPDANQAYLSRYFLYIRKYGTVYKIPFFAVIPGKATGMTWSSDEKLYISGTEGLSLLYVGS